MVKSLSALRFPSHPAKQGNAENHQCAGGRALAAGIWASQASVYEQSANIFAPYYRQMSTGVQMEEGELLATDTDEFKQGAANVQDAFDYYIANLNTDRPFILAGHSQGTMALIELIRAF